MIILHGKHESIPFIFDHQMAPLSVSCHAIIHFNGAYNLLTIDNIFCGSERCKTKQATSLKF